LGPVSHKNPRKIDPMLSIHMNSTYGVLQLRFSTIPTSKN
jgi:hypothetical protein